MVVFIFDCLMNNTSYTISLQASNKKSLKSAASTAQKAVTAAQALKRKYQEQRIKKSTVSTLTSKGILVLLFVRDTIL